MDSLDFVGRNLAENLTRIGATREQIRAAGLPVGPPSGPLRAAGLPTVGSPVPPRGPQFVPSGRVLPAAFGGTPFSTVPFVGLAESGLGIPIPPTFPALELLAGAFTGRPVTQATLDIGAKLAQSSLAPVRELGIAIVRAAQVGKVLSSQADLLSTFIPAFNAAKLQLERGFAAQPRDIQDLTRAVFSESTPLTTRLGGQPFGQPLMEVIGQLRETVPGIQIGPAAGRIPTFEPSLSREVASGFQTDPTFRPGPVAPLRPSPPMGLRGPEPIRVLDRAMGPEPVSFRVPAPQPMVRPQAEELLSRLRPLVDRSSLEEAAACTAAALLNPDLAAVCFGDLIERQVKQAGRDLLSGLRDLLRTQPTPNPPPFPIPERQPEMFRSMIRERAPVLDTRKPCPSCDRDQARRLQREEEELRQEIQTEQQQETQQKLESTEREIERLRELESKPAEQRDIPLELRRKQELLRDLQQLEGPGVSEPSRDGSGSAPTLKEPSPPPVKQRGGEPELLPSNQRVEFCLACKSSEDAVLFLNGEQAACSVMPGSFKEVR